MFPLTSNRDTSPNLELVRRLGWTVASATGAYCVAWRGREEILIVWRDGAWHRVNGDAILAAA